MKRWLFIVCALSAFIPVFGQEDYLRLQNEINAWYSSYPSLSSEVTPKVIEYPDYGYSVIGYFKKNILQEGSWVCLRNQEEGFKLSGIVMGASIVKGVREDAENICTYGTFKIANSSDGVFTSKVKKSGKLHVTDLDIKYFKGFYNDCPAILSLDQKCIAIDGKTGGRSYVGLCCPVEESHIISIGYRNFKELLLTIDAGCIEFENGYKFNGKLKPVLLETGYVGFRHLEGDEINTSGGFAKVSVKRDRDIVSMFRLYTPGGNVISEELIVPSSLISDENLWDTKMYYMNASEIRYKYTDNSSYKGKYDVKFVDSEAGKKYATVTITDGIYTFGNGDRFTGNLSGEHYGGVPIDGTMNFTDGTTSSGNWLLIYNLTQEQLDSLKFKKYPTDIRQQAKEYHFSNHYIKYEASWVDVFSPDNEECVTFKSRDYYDGGLFSNYYSYLRYDKKSKRFVGIDEYKGEECVDFELVVDDYGRHIEEIVYENKNPKYKNKLTWYSNGKLQSIKSYHYDTNEIYLVINCFSDGSFKNAYMYDKGNSGKNILRKSKEAHPTCGGFLTRQYDLDGNYEKTIEWSIGQWRRFLSSGCYGSRDDLAPSTLELNRLKRIK